MKQKTIILLFITALVSTLASCLSSDDDNPNISYEADYKNAAGQYTGHMYALDFKDPLKADTLIHEVAATIGADSTITFSSFPLYFIAKEISDAELREAVVARGNTSLKARYLISNSNDNYLYTYIIPESVVLNDFDYKGSKHKLTFSFVYPTEGFMSSKKYLQVPMLIGGIFIDDVLHEDFVNSKTSSRCILQFQGNAK